MKFGEKVRDLRKKHSLTVLLIPLLIKYMHVGHIMSREASSSWQLLLQSFHGCANDLLYVANLW